MRIEILYFASARDAAGSGSATLELPEGAAVGGAMDVLVERHPRLAELRASLRYAVNEEFVEPTRTLCSGDRLALLPPVSGG